MNLNVNNPKDLKELKEIILDKVMMDLSNGKRDGIYERISLQLDSSRKITPELQKYLLEKDKISVIL